jgi:Zn-dependent M16 (insulinase) family peptidase
VGKGTWDAANSVFGFHVTRAEYDTSLKTNRILFTHCRTKAKVFVIKNSDINRGFCIKFNTEAKNDKGTNHVIEHCIMSGSRKYPCENTLLDVSSASYVSYANALTYQNMTTYPVCSASEKQLLRLADIYLDSVYHPRFVFDERIFSREGWHYALSEENDSLCCHGVVYHEMQGEMANIETVAYKNAQKALFADTSQGWWPGGNPENMRDLTYREAVNTYQLNYHPSNSFVVLYGDLAYEPFLKMMDAEYYCDYNRKKYDTPREIRKVPAQMLSSAYDFPAAEGINTKGKSILHLAFAADEVGRMGLENYMALKTVINLLSQDDSEMMKAMMESRIGESYQIALDEYFYQPMIMFTAVHADPSRKHDFHQLIMKELSKIMKNDPDMELVAALLRTDQFKDALGNHENSAMKEMENACLWDTILKDPFVREAEWNQKIAVQSDEKLLKGVIGKQLLDDRRAVLTVTVAKAGLFEKRQKKLIEELSIKKASMTQTQVKKMVSSSVFESRTGQGTSHNVLQSLSAVSVQDIPVEDKEYEINQTTENGAKVLMVEADRAFVSSVYLIFDISHLTAEELLYLKFYCNMLNTVIATYKRTESQIRKENVYYANHVGATVLAVKDDRYDTCAHPVCMVTYKGFEEEYAVTFDLVSDMLLHARIDDITVYGVRAVTAVKAEYAYFFSQSSYLVQLRCKAYTSPTGRYINYLNGLDYYNFVLSLEKQIKSAPAQVAEKIKTVRYKAYGKNHLTILFGGDKNAQEKYKSMLPGFIDRFPKTEDVKAIYTLPLPKKREALAIRSAVQYLCVNNTLPDHRILFSGKTDVVTTLINNLWLVPEIRSKRGVYGVGSFTSDHSYIAYTYMDTDYMNSIETIKNTGKFLASVSTSITGETLENYKLYALANAKRSYGEVRDAMNVLLGSVCGETVQSRTDKRMQIKETAISDIPCYAKYIEQNGSDRNYVVAASQSEIAAHKDMFDTVITLPS